MSSPWSRAAVAPSEQREQLSKHREQIKRWLEADKPLRLTKVHELLSRRGVQTSYATLRRFVIDELGWRKRPVTVRVVDPPPARKRRSTSAAWARSSSATRASGVRCGRCS